MANPVVNIKFLADLAQFSSQMQNASRQMDRTGRKMQNMGKNLSVGLTAPLIALGFTAVKNFDKQAKAIAQVEAGLRSTGGAVGFTSKQLQKMASDLQNNTLFGDEEILKGVTSQLLTFTNIANQQFGRTQQVALDLATRLDGDLKSASIQLGKALNDPVANLSALSRSGIQFTKEQKAVINELANTNRLAEAQTLILDELEKQYGGSAQAAAEAGSGSLKQLGNILGDITEEFGAVILEGINPFIERLKAGASSFTDLDDSTKKIIVTVAAFAAGTGPALIVTGTLIRNVQTLIPLFRSLTIAIAANPIGALAVAVTALAGGVLVANSRLSSLTDATAEFAELTAKATGSVAKEKVELEKYLSVARNDRLSKEERQKAIKKLNALSPKYLGDLTLETINTKKAEEATKAYVGALLKKAKVLAAEEKLVEVEKKLLDLTLGQSDAVKPSIWQNLGNAFKSGGQAGAFMAATLDTMTENLTEENTELNKLKESLRTYINDNIDLTASLKETATAVNTVNKSLSGSGRKKQEKVEIVTSFGVVETGENPLKKVTAELPVYAEQMSAAQQGMLENALAFNEGFNQIWQDTASGFLENFGTLLAGFASGNAGIGDLAGLLLGTVADMAIQLGKLAIKIGLGVLAIELALDSLNPFVAIAAGVALVALGTLVKGAASNIASNAGGSGGAIPALANGGLVMGPTLALVGEYAGARSNPEVIAPLNKLQDLIRPDNQVSELLLKGELKARGQDLLLVIDRAQQKRNRTT